MSTISNERLEELRAMFSPSANKDVYLALGELLALRKERERAEPVGEVVDQSDGLVMDGTVHLGGSGTHRAIKGLNKMKRMPLGTKFYSAPPAPVVPDVDPSFDAMMRALDAFYADDNVPEVGMLAAFKILLADVIKQ